MEKISKRPYISLILPVYNEEAIIEHSLEIIMDYLRSLEDKYSWEIVLVNDGSKDKTGEIADSVAKRNKSLRIIHHRANMNLGTALQTGFKNAHGDIIVVLDLDLSYSVDHIGRMVEKQIATDADVVIASPYMKGGRVTGVPFKRSILSKTVNNFMRFVSQYKIHTFTGMVRAYKSEFIKNLNLKTVNYEVNPEILYKAIILRSKIVEIPAHLDWSFQNSVNGQRKSNMRLMKSFFSGLMAGFIFRPYIFFVTFGFGLFLISLYIIVWIFIHSFQIMPTIEATSTFFDDKFSQAVGIAFRQRPHAFYIGGITLILSIQVLSLGFMSLQKKRYFEELFHINSSILKQINENNKKELINSKIHSDSLT